MTRLFLVRHGPTSASDSARFPRDEPLSQAGRALAAELRGSVPAGARVLASPALRCRQTAKALGLDARIDPRLGECDFGRWAGRTLAEIHAADPVASERWMRDPAANPHGGESLTAFAARVAGWLDDERGDAGDDERGDARHGEPGGELTVAITHGGVIKAAVVHALDAPIAAFWRVSAAPLAVTELIRRCETWELVRANAPLAVRAD